MRKSFKPMKFVSFLELSNNEDELLELHGQSMSLNTQAENELKLRKSEMDLIKAKLKKVRASSTEVRVTDHAVVRYLERVTGLDIDACREEMLSKLPKDFKQSDEVEFVKIDTAELHYVMRDNLVISVTPVLAVADPNKEAPNKNN